MAMTSGVEMAVDPCLDLPRSWCQNVFSHASDYQAQADAARAAMLETSGQQAITPQMVQRFARTARERIRIDGGGYRRDHLRALAQRVEVADREVRITGSKSNLFHALTATSGVKSAALGIRSSVLKWRRGCPPLQ